MNLLNEFLFKEEKKVQDENTRVNDLPDLPSVPLDLPNVSTSPSPKENDDAIDFDDLSKRFEQLKKKR